VGALFVLLAESSLLWVGIGEGWYTGVMAAVGLTVVNLPLLHVMWQDRQPEPGWVRIYKRRHK
jgi:hypothetical protein